MRKAVADLNRKHAVRGKKLIDINEFLVTAEHYDIPKPTLRAHFEFDVTSFHREFAKMALGLGHFVYGEVYSRSQGADLVRRFLWEPDASERQNIPVRGVGWPVAPSGAATVLAYKDWHVVSTLTVGPLVFFANIFSKYYSVMQLANDVRPFTGITPAGEGAVFLIDPVTRKVRRFGYGEFIARAQKGSIED